MKTQIKNIIGKIWASPMTIIGLVVGSVLTLVSKLIGRGGSAEIANNAITFTCGLDCGGSITLGNVIIHAGRGVDTWNKDSTTTRYDRNGYVNLGKHEEAHTYQYEKYGVLMIPILLGSAIKNGGLREPTFHNFMAKSNLEKAADDYAQFT